MANNELDTLQRNADAASQKLDALEQSGKRAKIALSNLDEAARGASRSLKSASDQTRNLSSESKDAAKSCEDLQKGLQGTKSGMEKMGSSAQDASKKAEGLGKNVKENVAKSIKEAGEESEKTGNKLSESIKSFGKVAGGMGSIVKGVDGLSDAIGSGNIEQGLSSIAGAAGGVADIVSKIPGPAGLIVGVGTALVGVAFAIGDYMQKAHEAAVKADLEKHFGNITLSAEETEKVAERLTTRDWTVKIDAVVSAQKQLSELEGTVKSSLEKMNEANWKVRLGVELTADDTANYKSAADSYIKGVQDFMRQKQFTVAMSIDAIMTPGTSAYKNLTDFTTQFYNGSQTELEELGKELAETVDKALADGILTEDEVLNIQNLQNKMQAITSKAADTRFRAKMKALEMQAPDDGLDAASFQALQGQIAEGLKERSEASQEAYLVAIENVELSFEKGAITDTEYKKALAQINEDFNRQKGELVLDNLQVQMNLIDKSYHDQISGFWSNVKNDFQQKARSTETFNIQNFMASAFDGIEDSTTRDAVGQLVETMKPTTKQLEDISNEYYKVSKVPPENIVKGLEQAYQLEASAGKASAEHKYALLASMVASNDDFKDKLLKSYQKTGDELPKGLADALQNNYGLEIVGQGAGAYWDKAREVTNTKAQDIVDLVGTTGIKISEKLGQSLADKGATACSQTVNFLNNIKSGVELSQDQMKILLSNLGIEMTDGFANTLRTKSPETQTALLQMLADLSGGTALKAEELTTLFSGLGMQIPDSMITSIVGMTPALQEKTLEMLDKVNSGIKLKESELTSLFSNLGIHASDSFISSLAQKDPEIQQKFIQSLDQLSSGTEESRTAFIDLMKTLGLDSSNGIINSLVSQYGLIYDAAIGQWTQIKDVATFSKEEVKSLLGLCGIDASDALINSMTNLQPSVRATAAELLNQLQYADAEQRPTILANLMELGIAADSSFGQGIYDNISFVRDSASHMINVIDTTTGQQLTQVTPNFVKNMERMGITGINGMDDIVKETKLTSPSFNDIEEGVVKKWSTNAQYYLDKHSLSFTIKQGGMPVIYGPQMYGHATGGIFATPHIAQIAEEAPGEAVIPLSPARRTRALDLWVQTGEHLGIQETALRTVASSNAARLYLAAGTAQEAASTVDYARLALELADELRRAPVEVNTNVQITQGDVYLDGAKTGRALAPHISRRLAESACSMR